MGNALLHHVNLLDNGCTLTYRDGCVERGRGFQLQDATHFEALLSRTQRFIKSDFEHTFV